MILRVNNWREFQHYAKRRPPWIKLHHALLDNRTYLQLPLASRALAPLLWLIASERDGEIPDAISEITFRLRMSEQDTLDALAPLLAGEFFSCEQGASADASAPSAGLVSQSEESRGEGKPLQGLPLDSSVETSPPVAARGGLGGPTHEVGQVLANLGNLKRVAQ